MTGGFEDGAWMNGHGDQWHTYPTTPSLPVDQLPRALTEPQSVGEWVLTDELCDDKGRRTAYKAGRFVPWAENFRQP